MAKNEKEIVLTDNQKTILKKYGIKGATDSEVRPAVLAKLKENEVEEVDTDPIDDLINILDAFVVVKPETAKKVTAKKVVEEEEEEDEVPVTDENEIPEEEEEEVIPKKTKKVEKEKAKVVAEKPKKEDKTKTVKEATPVKKEEKKAPAKVEAKPAKKVVKAESKEELDELAAEAKDTKPEKAGKKEAKEKTVRGNTNQYDGDNEDHVKRLKAALKDVLKLKGFTLTYSKARVTGRVAGSVSGRTLFSIEQIRFKGDKINLSVVYTGMNLFKSNQDVAEFTKTFLGEAEQDMIVCENNAYPRVRSIPATDLTKFMTQQIIDTIVERINKLDGTLNNNRKKMQEKIED